MKFLLSFFKCSTSLTAIILICSLQGNAQNNNQVSNTEEAMLNATKYMVETVSTNGGYLWYYMPDFSRRWGEMEAYKTMIWLQHPGTVSMGHVFLSAYHVTHNEYYYEAACKAANATIWGQSYEGGWNYMIDFAGDRSLKNWYNTIGKNGWRLEEFQHYYGNSTFDDDVTSDAARYLLEVYLEKLDPKYKPALDKAINFIIKSQYPNGGWPQRYPLKNDFHKQGHPDYTGYYTFNDDVIWENTHFLIQCYLTLGEERFLNPIQKGMNFYVISQDTCGAWAQQLDMDMKIAGARTYEPAAFLPSTTCENALLLLDFYKYTGDKKFLKNVPKVIKWLNETRLPETEIAGKKTHPMFVDPITNKPIYVHRKGTNVRNGEYYIDTNDTLLLKHYSGKCWVDFERLKSEYERLSNISVEEATNDSPLKIDNYHESEIPSLFSEINRHAFEGEVTEKEVVDIIKSLDEQHRWLAKHAYISNPYTSSTDEEVNDNQTNEYASTVCGDKTDTSPYPDKSDQLYISTREYIRNMNKLILYIQNLNNKK